MIDTELHIVNKYGLHARSTAKLVATASSFGCDIQVGNSNKMVSAKSIMSVMMLAAKKGTILRLSADGEDAELAIAAVQALAANCFDEAE